MSATEITQEERRLYEALLEERARRDCEQEREELPKSLSKFIASGWHVLNPEIPYHHNWHIDAICEHLEAVSKDEILRLQVWVPPGSMKTGTVSVFWHAWEWTTRPWLRYWSASYETRLAGRMSSMTRSLMTSEWYQARWSQMFRFAREGEFYYSNDRGGTRLATAPRSTGTGEHGHRIIIDDPIKADAADATSRTTLNEANEWYDNTVTSRGIDIGFKHARVIVMQRLHENDLAAHVLEVDDWDVLCLPERYEANHPFVWPDDPRTEGELLWPEHRDEKASNSLARSLTTHRAAGQLQQRPSAREGDMLRRDWWRFYDNRIRAQEKWKDLGRFGMIVISVDTPLKDKETSDNVAIQCWGVKGADRYLLDIRLGKMNYGLAKRTIREMAVWARRIWKGCPHYVLIENAGYGVELIIDLKRELTGVQKVSPGAEGNKETRAESASDALESGNYFLPGVGPPCIRPTTNTRRRPMSLPSSTTVRCFRTRFTTTMSTLGHSLETGSDPKLHSRFAPRDPDVVCPPLYASRLMETLTAPRLSATVIVRCVQCGDACEITERQHRRKQQEGRQHKCSLCRAVKVKPPTESDYNYWLKRYTIGEIREMAQAIWG